MAEPRGGPRVLLPDASAREGSSMLMPPSGGLILSDPYGRVISSDQPKGPISASPVPSATLSSPRTGGQPGSPRAGSQPGSPHRASSRHVRHRWVGRRRRPPAGLAGGFLPAPATDLLPGDPLRDPLSGDPAASLIPGDPPGNPVHGTPAPPGLNPGLLATLTDQCPGLRVDHILRHGGKSVLAGGYVGEQPVFFNKPGATAP